MLIKNKKFLVLSRKMEKYEYKIVLIGESGTGGKTSLINRLVLNIFDPNTIATSGASYTNIFVQVNLGIIKLELWDTAGQEKYRGLNRMFIKGSHCIILGYDITNRWSFEEIKNYQYNTVKDIVGDDALIYLVANKIELFEKEEVSEDEARDYAKEKGIKYFGVSCKTGRGINELLEDIAYSLIMKFKRVLDIKDRNLLREITKNGTIIDVKERLRLMAKEKIEIILNKYYNH